MANLLDRASVVLTATAYNNGEALCIKPDDASGDFTFSRNSAATRVNAQGLVENVQILSSNLVQNGDFSEEGVEEVSNGSFSQEGSELVTNGDFATDSDWTKGTGWSISGGSANCDGTQTSDTFLYQNIGSQSNKTIKYSFTVNNYVSGTLKTTYFGATGTVVNSISANGDYVFYVNVQSGHNGNTGFKAEVGFIGSIDNVSVREVGQDWLFAGGSEITEQGARINNTITGVNAYIRQSNSNFTIGKSFVLEYDVVATNGTTLAIEQTSSIALNTSTVGSNRKIYFQWDIASTGLVIKRLTAGTDVTITNISVKEVGQNWDLGSGWSIGNGVAISDGVSADSNLNTNNIGYSVGDLLKVSFSVSNVTGGTLQIGLGATQTYSGITDGDYEFITTATRPDGKVFFKSVLFDGSITNISVIEITDDTNLPRINYEGFSYDGSGNVVPGSGCGSWLFESQSTNLRELSNTYVGDATIRGTISNDASAVSPSGLLGVEYLTATGTNGLVLDSSTLTGDGTFSVYLKRKTGVGDIRMSINGGVSNTTMAVTDVWKRFSLSSTTGLGQLVISCLTSGDEVYIWGWQEEALSYPTSLIPTDGSQTTRNQDLCTNGGSLASINSTEGVLYAEIAALANDGTDKVFSLNSGSFNNRVQIGYTTVSNQITAIVQSNGVFSFNVTTILADTTQINKIAVKYSLNDFSLWVNGVKVTTDTSGNTPIGLNNLDFNISNVANFFGKTKALAVWKEALSDAELTELTTI